MKFPEILAPAGSKEAFIGAISSGANAVYLAGKKFGARAFADNFTNEALKEMVHHAHMRNVLVYVTINTLVYDDEIEELLAYTDYLVSIGVDALIVQDLGVLDLCIHRYPDTDIHVSTQMNTHSIEQVKFLKSLGVKRIVLARETKIELIKTIKKEVDIEIEVFVHGALCVSYSGQCLMSSMMGGRSGNRGECAQPCRLPYTLLKDNEIVSETSYLLSTKDLMTIEYMKSLIEANIDSFKIEGRMRKAYYVIQAVLSYKKARDSVLSQKIENLEKDIINLNKVFNRSFTKGFLLNELPKEINQNLRPNHMGIPIGEVIGYNQFKVKVRLSDQLKMHDGYRIISQQKDYGNIVTRLIKDGELVKEAYKGDIVYIDVKDKIEKGAIVLKTLDQSLEDALETYINPLYPLIPLIGTCIIKKGKPISFEIRDQHQTYLMQSSEVVLESKTHASTKDQVIEKLSRLGDTPCYFESLNVFIEEGLFIPIKMLNQLRRDLINHFLEERSKIKPKTIVSYEPSSFYQPIDEAPRLVVKVSTEAQYEAAQAMGIEKIYVDHRLNILDDAIFYHYPNIEHRPKTMKQNIVVAESGTLYRMKDQSSMIIDYHFNVTNIYTAHLLNRYQPKSITLSRELYKEHLQTFHAQSMEVFKFMPPLEYIVYGRAQLMTTKYCPIAKTFDTLPHCHLCEKNKYALKNQKGQVLPLVHNGYCELNILQDKPLHLISYIKDIISCGIYRLRLDFTVESFEETKKVIADFQMALQKNHIMKADIPFTEGRYLG